MSNLWLPSSVVEQLAEERARERLSALGRTPAAGVPVLAPRFGALGLGRQPSKAKLLQETRGWAAIAGRAIVRRLQSVSFLAVERVRNEEGKLVDTTLYDHPLAEVLARPNPIFRWRQLSAIIGWHFLQTGEAYLQKIRDGLGVVRELWPLPVQAVTPIFDRVEVIAGYEVASESGARKLLPREDVVRIWDPDPETLYSAMGVLGPQAVEWDAERFRLQHLREHFGTDALPRVVLESEHESPAPRPEERDLFEEDWRQRYHQRSGRARGIPAILPSGVKAHELSAHGGVSETVPLGDAWAKQIMMAYGVPRSVVGDVVDVNRAAAESNRFVMDINTVEPLVVIIAEALTEDVAREYDPRLAVGYEKFVEPDKDFQLRQEAQDLAAKVRSPQQVLRDRGANPDDAPWGELPVGSLADAPYTGEPVDDGAEAEEEIGAAPAAQASAEQDDEPEEDEDRAELVLETEQRSEPGDADAAWERVLATERRWLGRFKRALVSVWEAQRREVVRAYLAAQGEGRSLAGARAAKAKPVSVSSLFSPRQWERLFRVRVDDAVRLPLYRAEGRAAQKAVGGKAFVFAQEQERKARALGAAAVTRVNETTRRRIASVVERAAAEGLSVDDAAKRLTQVFRDRKRARTVARTEILKTAQAAQLEGFRGSGVVERKRWNTSRDDAVRDSHEIDGQTVELDDDFELGSGALAAHPGDPRLEASDVVNCRCFVTPVVRKG